MYRNRTETFNTFKSDRPKRPLRDRKGINDKFIKFITLYKQIQTNLSFLQNAIRSLYTLHTNLLLVIIDHHYEDTLQSTMIDSVKEIKLMISQIHAQLNHLEKEPISITLKQNVIFMLRCKFRDLKYDFHHTCTDYKYKLEFWDKQENLIKTSLFNDN